MPDRTTNPQSRDFYTKGRQALKNRSKSALNNALECFQSALASDPDSALAYSGLADAYTLLYVYHLLPLDQSLEKARAAAKRAMEIDDSLAEVHTSVGHVSEVFDGDSDRAEQAYQRAISINDGYTAAHLWYSALLNSKGEFKEALKEAQYALRADPDSTVLHTGAAFLKAKLGRWDEAAAGFEKAVLIDPQDETIRINYSLLLAQMGRKERSLKEIEVALQLAPSSSFVRGVYGSILYYTRQYDQAIDVLEEALAQTGTASPMGRLILGQCYLQKGLYEKALDEFHKALVPSDAYTGETDLSAVATGLIGITFARMGEKNKAGEILADLASSAGEGVHEPCWLGLLCIALDEQDRGFQFLEQALESGDMWLRYILVQPLFDDIRSEVRYKALLERMNLEDIPST